MTDERTALRAVAEANRLVEDLLADAAAKEQALLRLLEPILLETAGDATGSWDPDRIEQALTNLIANAIQYGSGSPVRVRSMASAADIADIKFHNGGAVIPAGALPELFKAYRRGVRGASADQKGGVGLGYSSFRKSRRRMMAASSRNRPRRAAPRSRSSCQDPFRKGMPGRPARMPQGTRASMDGCGYVFERDALSSRWGRSCV